MKKYNVILNSAEEAEKFVSDVSELPFDVNLGSGSRIVDAKSLLGVLYLGTGRPLVVSVLEENAGPAEKVLEEYLIKSAA